MADSSKSVDPALLQALKAKHMRQAEEQFDRDMKAMADIAAKYSLPFASLVGGKAKPSEANGASLRIATTSEVVKAAADWLRRYGKRAKSGPIADALIAQGLLLGDKPGKKVSSYLTRSKGIFDNAADGYGLVEWASSKKG